MKKKTSEKRIDIQNRQKKTKETKDIKTQLQFNKKKLTSRSDREKDKRNPII